MKLKLTNIIMVATIALCFGGCIKKKVKEETEAGKKILRMAQEEYDSSCRRVQENEAARSPRVKRIMDAQRAETLQERESGKERKRKEPEFKWDEKAE